MFTATTVYQILISLLGAVSVRGDCCVTPDNNGVVNIPNGTKTIPERVSTNYFFPPFNIISITDRILHSNRLPLHRLFISVVH